MEAFGIVVLAVALMVYFFPAFIACKREHRNASAITALNLLLGWTFLGWVVAMVWACTDNIEQHEPVLRASGLADQPDRKMTGSEAAYRAFFKKPADSQSDTYDSLTLSELEAAESRLREAGVI